MTFLIKKSIKRGFAMLRALSPSRKNFGGIRIIIYHSIGGKPSDHSIAIRVPKDNFITQLADLKKLGYKTITISEIVKNWPAVYRDGKVLAITFDDGYRDNILEAASALKDNGMKATFFITTSYIDGKANKRWIDGSQREYMDWKDVAMLVEMGFEVGSHMVEHIGLIGLSDEQLFYQLSGSRDRIKEMAGFEPKTLSYPYGKFDKRVIQMAASSGYLAACSSLPGINKEDADHYILRRTEIDGYDTAGDFRSKLAGYYD
jgi:peptidoglycan/xylan/chitin deacetylase (PgdA/CDA1 family)